MENPICTLCFERPGRTVMDCSCVFCPICLYTNRSKMKSHILFSQSLKRKAHKLRYKNKNISMKCLFCKERTNFRHLDIRNPNHKRAIKKRFNFESDGGKEVLSIIDFREKTFYSKEKILKLEIKFLYSCLQNVANQWEGFKFSHIFRRYFFL